MASGGSAYASSSSGGSAYATSSRSGGSAYSGGGTTGPPKKKSSGGFFHTLGQGLKDLETTAVNAPGGAYLAGKALAADVNPANIVTSAKKVYTGEKPRKSEFVSKVLLPMATGVKQDVQHPLRHPGFTALDLLALGSLGAGAAARGAAAGRAVSEGARASEVGRALIEKPVPGPRVLRSSGIEVKVPASRSALTRGVQRQIDKLRERFPDAHIGIYDQPTRVGRELARQRAFDYKLETTPFTMLRVAGRKIRPDSPQGRAMRAVAEGTPLNDVIRFNREALAQAKNKVDRAALKREIRIAEQARQYVNERTLPNGKVELSLSDPKLQNLYERTRYAALLEDRRMAATGQLPEDVAKAAIQAPGRIYQGAEYVKPTRARLGVPTDVLLRQQAEVERLQRLYDRAVAREAKASSRSEVRRFPTAVPGEAFPAPPGTSAARGSLAQRLGAALSVQKDKLARLEDRAASRVTPTGLVGQEGFTGGQFHVGQERRPKPFSVQRTPQIGSNRTVGIPETPGRLTHALTGEAIRKGGLRHDVPNLVAENALESERHAALLRARDFFISHAYDTPQEVADASGKGARPVPIRLDELKGKSFPDQVKLLQDAYANGRRMDANETGLLGMTNEAFRSYVFPEIKTADVEATPGVKWIDERLLGGLNKPRPLATLQTWKGGRLALRFNDAVNNATKFSILYLKPAYALPNMLGNTFLNLVQQGWAAPANIGRAAKLSKSLGAEDAALVDNLMGEGIVSSLRGRGEGGLSRATATAARIWSTPVDVPFRRASFLYEARRAGFKTPGQMRRLLHDERYADQLQEVTTRANRAIIDYGDLTPIEQDIVRRVLFFYPWLKGSTRYAGEFLREHPLQAAFLSGLAKQGQAAQQRELGPVPPFGEGLFKVGERGGQPLVSNPTAAGVLSQPADLAAIGAALLSGHVPRGREASSLLSPFLGAGTTALAGYDPFTGKVLEPNLRTFLSQLTAGQPIPTLIERLRKPQQQKLFPVSKQDAILQFLLGGVAPRPVNTVRLNEMAAKANAPRTR